MQIGDCKLGTNAEAILERLLMLGVRAGKVADARPDTRLGRHVAGQLVRCATSPSPNYAEGCSAESREDFIHKLSIVLKELRETGVWLKFIARAELLPKQKLADLLDESRQLENIIAKSLLTAKSNAKARR